MAKEMSIDGCVQNAQNFISETGVCLLLFDVNNSRTHPDRYTLQKNLQKMMADLNQKFNEYFPKNNLAASSREEKGFIYLLGDGSWAGINSAEVIPKIINYQRTYYPDIDLRWGVAKDGYDNSGIMIVK